MRRAGADQGLVDGVVHDLEDELVQTVQAGGADVHAGPLADVLQTLENLYVVCAVGFVHGERSCGSPSPYEEIQEKINTAACPESRSHFPSGIGNWEKPDGLCTAVWRAAIVLAGRDAIG